MSRGPQRLRTGHVLDLGHRHRTAGLLSAREGGNVRIAGEQEMAVSTWLRELLGRRCLDHPGQHWTGDPGVGDTSPTCPAVGDRLQAAKR